MTQAALARAAGITVGHLAHLRRGTRGGGTRPDTIAALASALQVSPSWLATGEGPPPEAGSGPPLLRHRPEWEATFVRVLQENPEMQPDLVAGVGEMLDDPTVPALDAVFVRDMAFALAALRARNARRVAQ